MHSTTPNLRTKLRFWLLLSVLSVALAEVTVASAPFAFINPVETAFLTIFYGSHLLLLAWFVFRRSWPSLPALWFAGVLFGMYEFYITKVLWAPPWGDTVSLGHIDVVSFVVLVFFWHPFMAFILPLAIGEATGSATAWVWSQLPDWLTRPRRRRAMLGAAIVALTFGTLTGSPLVAFLSAVSATSAVALVLWWWRRDGRRVRWSLRELLPNDRQAKGIGIVVALEYLLFVPTWSRESLPPLVGHIVVWLLYAGFGFLLAGALRRSQTEESNRPRREVTLWPPRKLMAIAGALVAVALLGSLGPAELGFIPVWAVAIVIGSRMFVRSVRYATGRDRKQAPVS